MTDEFVRRAPVFYIKAPGYTPSSGGVIACHVLCHNLNRLGYEAYVAAPAVSGALWTPLLTSETVSAHEKAGRRPIAIYPEVYTDNELNCDRVIRYLLNRPGVFSVADTDATNAFWRSPTRKSEFHIHYAEEFRVPYLNSVLLYTPIVDEAIFFEESSIEREGFLVYSHRREVHDDMVPNWSRPYTLVSMVSPRSPQELAHLYRRSRALIVFERTGARMEAAMCGCPVVAIPSESFPQLPLFHLYGSLGLGWGTEMEQLHWAQRTLPRLQQAYRAQARGYPAHLAEVVEAALRFFAKVRSEWAEASAVVDVDGRRPTRCFPKALYRAKIQTAPTLLMKPGEVSLVTTRVTNDSPKTWPATAESGITLGNHWFSSADELVVWADGRTELHECIPSGATTTLDLQVRAPTAAGEYLLEVDLVQEGVAWFKDRGSQAAVVQVHVAGQVLEGRVTELESELNGWKARALETESDLKGWKARVLETEADLKGWKARALDIESSRSWRITGPLRAAATLFRRIFFGN